MTDHLISDRDAVVSALLPTLELRSLYLRSATFHQSMDVMAEVTLHMARTLAGIAVIAGAQHEQRVHDAERAMPIRLTIDAEQAVKLGLRKP